MSLHNVKAEVWCAMSANKITEPYSSQDLNFTPVIFVESAPKASGITHVCRCRLVS
jgi:hypothetical protein